MDIKGNLISIVTSHLFKLKLKKVMAPHTLQISMIILSNHPGQSSKFRDPK